MGYTHSWEKVKRRIDENVTGNPSLIDNFPPNTLLATLEELLLETASWDIATGTFDIGSSLALGELWQPIKPVRILMGDETTRRTRKELLNATSQQADDLRLMRKCFMRYIRSGLAGGDEVRYRELMKRILRKVN